MPLHEIAAHFGGAEAWPVPIPHDCRDGFLHAYWRRPEAYLDPVVRAGISVFALVDQTALADELRRLEADLPSGRWRERSAAILTEQELDLGYRLLVTPDARVGP